MEVQEEGEEAALIDDAAAQDRAAEVAVIERAVDLQQATANLTKSFGVHLSQLETLDPGQCPLGWDPAKSLVPGVIIKDPQTADNLVKWLQEGHADRGVTWIKEEIFGEEVTPLTPESVQGVMQACKDASKVYVAGKEFPPKNVKPIPVLRMGSDLRVVECSRGVNQVLSQNVTCAKASLIAREHFGTEQYGASKEPMLHVWRSIGEERRPTLDPHPLYLS